MVGPGTHKDQENFKSLRPRPCKAVMYKQYYDRKNSLSNSSGKSSNRSSRKKFKSAKKEETFIQSGHLIGMSPHHGKKDSRLNYEMY